jgi:2-(1,2-epoxy-1,2-dihydrophenyl)acetyl-CoA isomerase
MAQITHDTIDGAVARIAIERPAKRNAMSPETRNELIDAIDAAIADPAIGAILLASNGGHFCAGGDIDAMDVGGAFAGRNRMRRTHRLVHTLLGCDKPVIAAIEGFAVGAGASLALLADSIVIAAGGTIGFPFFHVGLVPDCGLFYTLPRRVGPARARQLLLYARMVADADALAIGLADMAAAKGEAEKVATGLAGKIMCMPPGAFALAKRQLAMFPTDLDTALELEAMAQAMCFTESEFAEGRAAFKEKRRPDFRGQAD